MDSGAKKTLIPSQAVDNHNKLPNLMHEFAYAKSYYCLMKYMNLPSAKNQHKNA